MLHLTPEQQEARRRQRARSYDDPANDAVVEGSSSFGEAGRKYAEAVTVYAPTYAEPDHEL